MSYHIEYIPQTHDRTNHSKGNGGQVGSGVHHLPKLDPITGLKLGDYPLTARVASKYNDGLGGN